MSSTHWLLMTLNERLDLSVPQFLHLSNEDRDRATLCVRVCDIGVNVWVCVRKCVCDCESEWNGRMCGCEWVWGMTECVSVGM